MGRKKVSWKNKEFLLSLHDYWFFIFMHATFTGIPSNCENCIYLMMLSENLKIYITELS